jgi:hypothetical protein
LVQVKKGKPPQAAGKNTNGNLTINEGGASGNY